MYGRLPQQPSTRQSIATRAARWPAQTPRMLATLRRLSPCMRRVRGSCSAAADSSDTSTDGLAYASKVWTKVVEGGMQEAETNYHDAQGYQCTYSEFAAWGLRKVVNTTASSSSSSGGGGVDMIELQQQMQSLADHFDQYTAMQQPQRQMLLDKLLQQIRPKVDDLLAVLAGDEGQPNSMPATSAAVPTPAAAAETGQEVANFDGNAPGDDLLLQQPTSLSAVVPPATVPPAGPAESTVAHGAAEDVADADACYNKNAEAVAPAPVLHSSDRQAAITTTSQNPPASPAAAAPPPAAVAPPAATPPAPPPPPAATPPAAAPPSAAAAAPAVAAVRPRGPGPLRPRPRILNPPGPLHLQQQQQLQQHSPAQQPSEDTNSEQQQQSLHHQQQQQQQPDRLQPSLSSLPAARPRPRPRRPDSNQPPLAKQQLTKQHGSASSAGPASTSSSSSGAGLPKLLLVSPSNATAVAAGLARRGPTAAAAAAAVKGPQAKVVVGHPVVRRTPKQRSDVPGNRLQQQQQLIPPWQIYFGPPPYLAPADEQVGIATSNSSSSSSSVGLDPSTAFGLRTNTASAAAGIDLHSARNSQDAPEGHQQEEDEQILNSTDGISQQERKRRSEANWESFVAAANANERRKAKKVLVNADERIKQGSGRWHEIREGRLTGSALCNMLGWFNRSNSYRAATGSLPEQVVLWRDLVGIEKKTYNKEAMRKMRYGNDNETAAKQSYQGLVPHELVEEQKSGFAVWGNDELHSWLGASPDGLLTILPDKLQLQQATAGIGALDGPADGAEDAAAAAAVGTGSVQPVVVAEGAASTAAAAADAGMAAAAAAGAAAGPATTVVRDRKLGQVSVEDWVKQQTGTSLEGVLEIKCPFKYGPEGKDGRWKEMPLPDEYYMMQVQTQLEVLDREWAVVYYWSSEIGSRMTLIKRDRGYFAILWQVMADFWWQHVVPAKHTLDQYKQGDPQRPEVIRQLQAQHEPVLSRDHPYQKALRRLSKQMVDKAPTRTFTKEETQEALLAGRLIIPDDVERPEDEDEWEDEELSDLDPSDHVTDQETQALEPQ